MAIDTLYLLAYRIWQLLYTLAVPTCINMMAIFFGVTVFTGIPLFFSVVGIASLLTLPWIITYNLSLKQHSDLEEDDDSSHLENLVEHTSMLNRSSPITWRIRFEGMVYDFIVQYFHIAISMVTCLLIVNGCCLPFVPLFTTPFVAFSSVAITASIVNITVYCFAAYQFFEYFIQPWVPDEIKDTADNTLFVLCTPFTELYTCIVSESVSDSVSDSDYESLTGSGFGSW